MTLEEVKEYYSNLLIIQYHQKAKAKATVELFSSILYMNNLNEDIRNAFDIDTAVGQQLDWIGKYVGVDRFYEVQEFADNLFGMITYDEVDSPPTDRQGFTDYANFDSDDGDWLTYNDIISQTNKLPDAEYRIILKLKIIQNNSNHSVKQIDDSLFAFFGTEVVMTDNQDMTMTYFVPNDKTAILTVALQKGVLPKPMGVGLITVERDRDVFAFYVGSSVPTGVQGFSQYSDFDQQKGETLTYDKF